MFLRTLLVLCAMAGAAPAAEPAFDAEAVDRIAGDALKSWCVPGLAIVIVRDDRVVLAKGYGTKTSGTIAPVTADTLFPLASCTKAFTTAALATLVDDGKLAWDDPVRKHLPTFHLSEPAADQLVSLRDLVTHRTGLAGHDLLWYRAPWSLSESIKRARYLPLSGPFRGSYHYSSLMFAAAGTAAANRAGVPWDEFVRTRITGPLQMTGVTFTATEAEKAKDRASGHRRDADGSSVAMDGWSPKSPDPAGSMSATARDLGAWLRFQLADGEFAGKRIASEKNLQETRTPHTPMPRTAEAKAIYPETTQTTYAMGWVVYDHRGQTVVAHGGIADGFRAQVTLLPRKKIGFALLNNLHDTTMNVAVGNAVIDLLTGLPARDWNAYYLKVEADERESKRLASEKRDAGRDPKSRPSLPLARYAGEYRDPAYGTATVAHTDGRLTLTWSSFRCPLAPFAVDTFQIADGYFKGELVSFEIANGRVVAVAAPWAKFPASQER